MFDCLSVCIIKKLSESFGQCLYSCGVAVIYSVLLLGHPRGLLSGGHWPPEVLPGPPKLTGR